MLLRLRNARTLARLVLVWFALALGVAVASPLVKPQALTVVCSGAGMLKLLDAGDGPDAGAALSHADLWNCALCVTTGAPPPVQPALPFALPRASAWHLPASPWAVSVRSAAPQPGRGPPAHS